MGNTLCESEVQGGNVVAHVVVFYYATVFMKSKKKTSHLEKHIFLRSHHTTHVIRLLDHAHQILQPHSDGLHRHRAAERDGSGK